MFFVFVCAGDTSTRPESNMLARQDTDGAEAAVFSVRHVRRPVRISHHDWGLLQTE